MRQKGRNVRVARFSFTDDSIFSPDKCCYPMPIGEDYVKTTRVKCLRIFSIPKIRRVAERLTHHATSQVRLDKSRRDRRRGAAGEGGEMMREETSPYAVPAIGWRGSDKARSVKSAEKRKRNLSP